jgi:hypothetical protein
MTCKSNKKLTQGSKWTLETPVKQEIRSDFRRSVEECVLKHTISSQIANPVITGANSDKKYWKDTLRTIKKVICRNEMIPIHMSYKNLGCLPMAVLPYSYKNIKNAN